VATVAGAQEPWSERTIPPLPDDHTYDGVLDRAKLDALIQRGQTLFTAKFTTGDGIGRPRATQAIIPTKRKRPVEQAFQRLPGMDANSCSSCHNDPVDGGAGDFTVNVFVSEGFGNADFDSTDPQFSNERNTNHLMGAGLVELLAREMSADLRQQRDRALRKARNTGETQTVALASKGVDFGRLVVQPDGIVDLTGLQGVDTDLVIRPFSQKGVMTSLRQFTINAMNDHHGMEAVERFGARWTGESDFDEDGHADELSEVDISALVAWQATRPPPVETIPEDAHWQQLAQQGRNVFETIGCAECHRPALPLNTLAFSDPGPLDAAGTLRQSETRTGSVYDLSLFEWAQDLPRDDNGAVLVPLFGDLKRHRIADQQVSTLGNELLAQRFVERDVFMTAELWGIASTAPFGHRGDMTTLDEVITAHGGEARPSRDRYIEMSEEDRMALIAWLKTLEIPQ
jgi:cytochrome c peroxidase